MVPGTMRDIALSHPGATIRCMGRPRRIVRQDGFFHVMNRGVDRQPIFIDDADRVDFGAVLGRAAIDNAVAVHAYCLMRNHFHLIVECPDGGLSSFVHQLTATHARHVNDRHGRDGPLYRGRFKSLVIDDDGYLLAAVRYVHRNPAPDGPPDRFERYRWSSHRTYLQHRRQPPWLRTDLVLGLHGDDLACYREFTAAAAAGALPIGPALELATVEHADSLDRSPKGVERSVALALVQSGVWPPAALAPLGLSFGSERRRRQATWRAARTVRADPVLTGIADRAARLAA